LRAPQAIPKENHMRKSVIATAVLGSLAWMMFLYVVGLRCRADDVRAESRGERDALRQGVQGL
jgi:hypothetical protein